MAKKSAHRTVIVVHGLMSRLTMRETNTFFAAVAVRAWAAALSMVVPLAMARVIHSQIVAVAVEQSAERADGYIDQQKREGCQAVLTRRQHGTQAIGGAII
ncbi:MAG: hypothetical protein K2Y37_27155 [Pirellulales bacterium]|nr:hypothetical protein [Pirellulales bacterium]